ncbi:unnamed protein product [Dimorphilus gyrociliatus]|uniref:Uncharacterized protein n=1 Tax=Dimorphilus gyrociliatus TaxID=2664684 RepID=A0A7I8W7S1_9ANNE|nr:unnamed protein product [Dimorphilus gyrociliatus]
MANNFDSDSNDDIFKGCFDSESEEDLSMSLIPKKRKEDDCSTANEEEFDSYMQNLTSESESDSESQKEATLNNIVTELVASLENYEHFETLILNLPVKSFQELDKSDALRDFKSFGSSFQDLASNSSISNRKLSFGDPSSSLSNDQSWSGKAMGSTLEEGDNSVQKETPRIKMEPAQRKATVFSNTKYNDAGKFTNVKLTRNTTAIVLSSDEEDDNGNSNTNTTIQSRNFENDQCEYDQFCESDDFIFGLPVLETVSVKKQIFSRSIQKVAAKWETDELYVNGKNLTCCTSLRKKFNNKLPPSVYTLEGNKKIGLIYRKGERKNDLDLVPRTLIYGSNNEKFPRDQLTFIVENERRKHVGEIFSIFADRLKELLIERDSALSSLYNIFATRKQKMDHSHRLAKEQCVKDSRYNAKFNYILSNMRKQHQAETENLSADFESKLGHLRDHYLLRIKDERRRCSDMKYEIDCLCYEYKQTGLSPFRQGDSYIAKQLPKHPKQKLKVGEADSVVVYVPSIQGSIMEEDNKLYDEKYGYK